MTATRTDAHRPSAIEPADYDFVAFEYLRVDGIGDAQFLMAERARRTAHMNRTGGTYSGHEHGGNCGVCGSANAIYTALFHHRPSNTYVRTGLDCADKLECHGVEAFRRRVTEAREQRAGKRKAQALLTDAGLAKAWEVYAAGNTDRREESTVVDMVGKLVQYGSISDKQVNYLRVLVERIENRAAIEAQRAVETAAAAPVPVTDKRMTVRGTVLSVKVPGEFDIGQSTRMLVQHADGWKVFGTVPASIEGVARGDVVEFDAAVKVSDKDAKFGYFSRPTKARKVAA